MARSSYKSNKRQKELVREKKKELKRLRKIDKNIVESEIQTDPAQGIIESSETDDMFP